MPTPPYIRTSDGSIREGQIVRARDHPTITVDEPDLSFVRIDHQVRFQFGATEVVIESPFTLIEAAGFRHDLETDHRADLGPVLALYPDSLLSMGVSTDGDLRLDFESGATVVVPSSPHYEAWEVNGPGTRLVVCTPGGALGVWV